MLITTRRRATEAAVLLACALIATTALGATTIYRSVDANGHVTFSDQPPGVGETATTVEIQAPMSYPGQSEQADAPAATTWEWDMRNEADGTEGPDASTYSRLIIAAPTSDEAVRANDGSLSVVVAITPALLGEDRIELLLDGNPVAVAATTSFELTDVARGTHTLAARVIDPAGITLLTSAPTTFHVLRPSALLVPPGGPQPRPRSQ